jgi:hypothetical protein
MRGSSPFLKGVSTGSLCRRQESRFHIFIPNRFTERDLRFFRVFFL